MFFSGLKFFWALLLIAAVLASVGIWLIPVSVAQNWALGKAGEDAYARFEAVGQMQALWWLGRILLPCLSGLALAVILNLEMWSEGWLNMLNELRQLTAAGSKSSSASRFRFARSWILRGFLCAWILLAGVHGVNAVLQRTRDWPYYHWNPGSVVLPNISDSNRDVIRYLRAVTPEDSRLFVFSDQKLFFLSYYLLPRRLFHRIHEESEFVIPLANQGRQLEAYERDDLSPEVVDAPRPDFILEYFEGSRYNSPGRRGEDAQWVRFWQSLHQTSEIPPYVVVLSRVTERGQR